MKGINKPSLLREVLCNVNLPDRPKIIHSQCRLMSHQENTKKDKKENQTVLEPAFPSHPGYRP